MLPRINPEDLISHFIEKAPFIDVRAPVEYREGAIPGALNFPILTDEERAKVGRTYKQQGSEKATQLGHKLVSGPVKEERVQAWLQQIQKDPRTVIYCFRGGQRSQITQSWLAQQGIERPIISGGYKNTRQFLLEYLNHFSAGKDFFVLTGSTGSGKSVLLREVQKFYPAVDLEKHANHRGSAYGNLGPQPTQINFENELAVDLLGLEQNIFQKNPDLKLLVEDESRLVGSRALPESFFETLRSSPVIFVERTLEERMDQIYQEYIVEALVPHDEEQNQMVFAKYQKALDAIKKRLGGLKHQEITKIYQDSLIKHLQGNPEEHKNWIKELLIHYYDPLYQGSFLKRNPPVLFRGNHQEISEYLKSKVE